MSEIDEPSNSTEAEEYIFTESNKRPPFKLRNHYGKIVLLAAIGLGAWGIPTCNAAQDRQQAAAEKAAAIAEKKFERKNWPDIKKWIRNLNGLDGTARITITSLPRVGETETDLQVTFGRCQKELYMQSDDSGLARIYDNGNDILSIYQDGTQIGELPISKIGVEHQFPGECARNPAEHAELQVPLY